MRVARLNPLDRFHSSLKASLRTLASLGPSREIGQEPATFDGAPPATGSLMLRKVAARCLTTAGRNHTNVKNCTQRNILARFKLISAVSGLLIAAVGCGGDDDEKSKGDGAPVGQVADAAADSAGSNSTPDAGVTSTTDVMAVEQTPSAVNCTALAMALCSATERCAGAGLTFLFGTSAKCVERFKISCDDSVKAPQTGVTPAKAIACASAYASATCGNILNNNIPACDVLGPRANGQACGSNAQCQTGFCTTSDRQCGGCAPRASGGGSCTEDEGCVAGLVCHESLSVCYKPGQAGDSCSEPRPCAYGLFCKDTFCVASLTAGAKCDTDDDGCDFTKGLFCNPIAQVCQALQFADPGNSCGLLNGGFTACRSGECAGFDLDQATTTGVCASLSADGTACGVGKPGCQVPALCENGTCKLPNSPVCQ